MTFINFGRNPCERIAILETVDLHHERFHAFKDTIVEDRDRYRGIATADRECRPVGVVRSVVRSRGGGLAVVDADWQNGEYCPEKKIPWIIMI